MTALPDVETWLKTQKFKNTSKIKIPKKLIDHVIGQDDGVAVARKAALQRRHVLLIGDPGTGKSMLANAMAELLPQENLEDIIVYHNEEEPNNPKVRVVPAGKGKVIVDMQKEEARMRKEQKNKMKWMILAAIIGLAIAAAIYFVQPMFLFFGLLAAAMIYIAMRGVAPQRDEEIVPKLLLHQKKKTEERFVDATGAHAGALLGDVKHDPFQSGGLETPAHERVEIGAIHKAHRGVLFIDELNTLKIESQHNLLTAMQERKFPITGQSERSSGAMVKTDPVPCNFILVAAGNLETMGGMHPALRSRIRGYGYEIYVRSTIKDTDENRKKLVRFIAQEVKKDKQIPHFSKKAVGEIILEAQRRAGRRGHISLRLRELGGLVRVAGDIAKEKGSKFVRTEHVLMAKKIAKPLEQQVADRMIEHKKDYKTFAIEGFETGKVNGLALLGADTGMSDFSGIITSIVAEVTPAASRDEGKVIATGKLGEIAKEAVQNVSALFKKRPGKNISDNDVHIQFIGTYEGVEGDSASISIATAVISALEQIPVDQSVAMTGSLSVRGKVLPVGGVTAKIEAAVDAGITKVIIPRANMQDVLIENRYKKKIKIIPVSTLDEVLENALLQKRKGLIDRVSKLVKENVPVGDISGNLTPENAVVCNAP